MKEDWIRLIISDTHLGTVHAKEEDLLRFLQNTDYDELILAGDIFEFLRKPIFTKTTKEIIDLINSKPNNTIFIVGNHDDAFGSFAGSTVANIDFMTSYDFVYAGRKFRIEHGDAYDTGLVNWRYTIQFISLIQNMIERVFNLDLTTWWAERAIKKRKLRRIWDIIKWNEDADVFIMGHLHNPEVLIWVDKKECIKTYVNSGDWVANCTYVIIKDGQVRLRKFDPCMILEDEDTITAECELLSHENVTI